DAEPTLDFEAVDAGVHILKVEERAYQKGDNQVYRLTLGTGARLVAAFPQLLSRGKTQAVTFYGYRLRGGIPAGPGFPAQLEQVNVNLTAPAAGAPDGGGWTPASAVMVESFRYQHPSCAGGL